MSYLDGVGFGKDQIAYDGPEFIQWDWTAGERNVLLAPNEKPVSRKLVMPPGAPDEVDKSPLVPRKEGFMGGGTNGIDMLSIILIFMMIIVLAMQFRIVTSQKIIMALLLSRSQVGGPASPYNPL